MPGPRWTPVTPPRSLVYRTAPANPKALPLVRESRTTSLTRVATMGARADTAALRDQVTVRHLDIVESARMLAAVDMCVADAIITVWHAKYLYAGGGRSPRSIWRTPTATRRRSPTRVGCRCDLPPPIRNTRVDTTSSRPRRVRRWPRCSTRDNFTSLLPPPLFRTCAITIPGRRFGADVVNARCGWGPFPLRGHGEPGSRSGTRGMDGLPLLPAPGRLRSIQRPPHRTGPVSS